jgi:hypothetical protein
MEAGFYRVLIALATVLRAAISKKKLLLVFNLEKG